MRNEAYLIKGLEEQDLFVTIQGLITRVATKVVGEGVGEGIKKFFLDPKDTEIPIAVAKLLCEEVLENRLQNPQQYDGFSVEPLGIEWEHYEVEYYSRQVPTFPFFCVTLNSEGEIFGISRTNFAFIREENGKVWFDTDELGACDTPISETHYRENNICLVNVFGEESLGMPITPLEYLVLEGLSKVSRYDIKELLNTHLKETLKSVENEVEALQMKLDQKKEYLTLLKSKPFAEVRNKLRKMEQKVRDKK